MSVKTAKKKCYEDDTPPPISTVEPEKVLASVFKQLGRPADLSQMSGCLTRATPVNQSSFRVQIYRDMPLPTLTDTFFVHVNGEGEIRKSDPAINQRYNGKNL